MSGGFLEQMARSSAERVAQARSRVGEGELLARARALPSPPALALDARGFDLIAEFKQRSPAAGSLVPAARDLAAATRDLTERVAGYARAGAAAVSVLTEPACFDGSLEHLQAATRALAPVGVPAMRKDFLVDPYQVLEARVAGASGILVILRMLSERDTDALLDCAQEVGLFVLLEAFAEADIDRAHAIVEAPGGAAATVLVGLNCRDLDTLQVVPGRLESLVDRLPAGVPRVAESGVGSATDAARIAAAGYDLALVGSALMTGGDPAVLVRDMLAAGRSAAARRAGASQPAGGRAGARSAKTGEG
jgi:indole-3-glycerol phosphate synthase